MKKNNWLLPIIFTGLAVHTFNNKLFNISRDALSKKEVKQKVYNWKFGSVSYKEYGVGEPLLLVHDTFSGSSSIEFDRLVHLLSKNNKVYTIDLLGYGFSEKSNITYTAYLYVQLLNDFIHDIISENQVNIITSGNSNVFALFAAQQEKDLIKKCIMINPSDIRITSMNPTKRDRTLKYVLELPFFGTTLFNILHNKYNYIRQFNVSSKSSTMNNYIDQFYHNAHYSNSNTRFSFASNIGNYMNLSIKQTLGELNNSLYIINGSDRSVDANMIENQYTEINPSIESAKIKNSSDFPHLENPYATVDLINLFLQD